MGSQLKVSFCQLSTPFLVLSVFYGMSNSIGLKNTIQKAAAQYVYPAIKFSVG